MAAGKDLLQPLKGGEVADMHSDDDVGALSIATKMTFAHE